MGEKYKLTYFNIRARAEPIRMLFALAGVEYEDCRIDCAPYPNGQPPNPQWPILKPSTKWGYVPLLEVNGEVFGEIVAIEHYLTKKYGLGGQSAMEEFRVDEIVSAFGEILRIRRIFLGDPTKKEEALKSYINDLVKPLLVKMTELKQKNGGKWMVGQNVTLADIYLAVGMQSIDIVDDSLLPQFPAMTELRENFNALPQIKTWLDKRPQTLY